MSHPVYGLNELREMFLRFFESKGHLRLPSFSLIPQNDKSILLINAGMTPMKPWFKGEEEPPRRRVCTCQKCIRTGDIDNVGHTARHGTFFEMLGNFSFGDYFKHDAINFAWELLTKHFMLPAEKLWVTVYAEDDEAYNIWHEEVGVPAERIVRIGDNKGARYMSDNFWMMGDTGPCGPCTEIFYDHGDKIQGGPPGSPEEDGDRYIEIWNLVFMQFNRDERGVMHKLPKPSVDTGMGLERIAAVLQGVHNNYDIDLFKNLLASVKRVLEETSGEAVDPESPSLKVIADHIRACTFSVADGIVPGNEGRAYVLRRICRRAIRHGYKLGARKPFFYKLVDAVRAEMAEAYPEINNPRIEKVIEEEERRFFLTLSKGMEILDAAIAGSKDGVLDGEVVFKLHDTYGFPADLTGDVCRERDVKIDFDGFDAAMARQREAARASAKFKMAAGLEYTGADTVFTGYETLEENEATVLAVYKDGQAVELAEAGDDCIVVFDRTPFYAEQGGQVGDRGHCRNDASLAGVLDTIRVKGKVTGHSCHVEEGRIAVGDKFRLTVDADRRHATQRNHSATHLLQQALRKVLGEHVEQKGSLVSPTELRFDFSHSQAMTTEQIARVEDLVNEQILANTATKAEVLPLEEARKTGATMLFGEKYGDIVRVETIGNSVELCGGTHVDNTAKVGLFRIKSEGSVASGVRRIEAITGKQTLAEIRRNQERIVRVAQMLKTTQAELESKLEAQIGELKDIKAKLEKFKEEASLGEARSFLTAAKTVGSLKVITAQRDGMDPNAMRKLGDFLRDKEPGVVGVLASVHDGKVTLLAVCGKDAVAKGVKAGDIIKAIAPICGGKGGGKPDSAMGGGTEVSKVDDALAAVDDLVLKVVG